MRPTTSFTSGLVLFVHMLAGGGAGGFFDCEKYRQRLPDPSFFYFVAAMCEKCGRWLPARPLEFRPILGAVDSSVCEKCWQWVPMRAPPLFGPGGGCLRACDVRWHHCMRKLEGAASGSAAGVSPLVLLRWQRCVREKQATASDPAAGAPPLPRRRRQQRVREALAVDSGADAAPEQLGQGGGRLHARSVVEGFRPCRRSSVPSSKYWQRIPERGPPQCSLVIPPRQPLERCSPPCDQCLLTATRR